MTALIISLVLQGADQISFQGRLTDREGVPVDRQAVLMTFRLYDRQAGSEPVWMQDLSADVKDGLYTLLLGPFEGVTFDRPYWIGVAVDGGPEMSPRFALSAAPYCLGEPSASVNVGVRATPTLTGGVAEVHPTDNPNIRFHDQGRLFGIEVQHQTLNGQATGILSTTMSSGGRAVYGRSFAASGQNFGVIGESASADGRGVFGWATAPTGLSYGVWGLSMSMMGRGVYGQATAMSGETMGVVGQADSAQGRGVLGWATAGTGTTYGVWGLSASQSGRAVFGHATAGGGAAYGVYGQADSTAGTGVYGTATATSGDAVGVHGRSASSSGNGVLGETTATTGTTYGVHGRNFSLGGAGVFGETISVDGSTGVHGKATGSLARGVFGEATGTDGRGIAARAWGAAGMAVFAEATSVAGVTYGIYSTVTSATGWAAFFDGPAVGLTPQAFLNWGTTQGLAGYGLRDNFGVIEVKNLAGAWTPIGAGGVTSVTATAPLASSGGSTPNISLAEIVAAANGGTGLNTSASTGVPSISAGSWSVSSTLSGGLGGTGLNTSASTGVPSISGGSWSVSSTLSAGLGGTGLDTSGAAAGSLLRRNAAGTAWEVLPPGTADQVLSVVGGVPTWANSMYKLLFAQPSVQAGDAVYNTTAQTNFATSFTLPANALTPGKVIQVTASGVWSSPDGGGVQSLTTRVKLGGAGSVGTAASTDTSLSTNEAWRIECTILCVTAGVGGTVEVQGTLLLDNGFNADTSVVGMPNAATLTINTTIPQLLQLSCQPSQVSASLGMTMRQLLVEALN